MTPDQQIRTAALNAAVAWAEVLPALPEPILDTARRFEDYIRGAVVTEPVSDVDEFYCAGAVSGGTDARRGCSHPRHSHGPHGCTMWHGSMAVPNCPCERPNGD